MACRGSATVIWSRSMTTATGLIPPVLGISYDATKKRRKARTPSKRIKASSRKVSFPTAADIVEEINRKFPEDENDESVQAFRTKFSALVSRMVSWAKNGTLEEHREWVYQPHELREMSPASRFWLGGQDAFELIKTYLEAIPLRVQKIMGNPKVKASDLLDLPTGALDCRQWAVYLDVRTRLSAFNIYHVPDARSRTNRVIKTTTPGTNLRSTSESKVYVRSSTSAAGVLNGVTQHMRYANPTAEADLHTIERTAHYAFTSQQDAVPNFFFKTVVGRADTSDKTELMKARRPVEVLEAISITYLVGLLFRGIDTQYCLVPVPKFNDFLRDSLNLPNLMKDPLNRSKRLGLQSGSWRKCGNIHVVPGDSTGARPASTS
ncbi:hypothetical protein LQW54_001392 [Pestalotiopsis sp. IQ-011]